MAASFRTRKFSNWNICFLQRKYSSMRHLEKYVFATFITSSFERISLLGGKHHGILSDTVNQHKVNIFLRGSYLHFHMGEIRITLFAPVDERCFDFSFSLVSKLRSRNSFAMKVKFTFCSKTDDIILLKFVEF